LASREEQQEAATARYEEGGLCFSGFVPMLDFSAAHCTACMPTYASKACVHSFLEGQQVCTLGSAAVAELQGCWYVAASSLQRKAREEQQEAATARYAHTCISLDE
jgi:hypothetical protein